MLFQPSSYSIHLVPKVLPFIKSGPTPKDDKHIGHIHTIAWLIGNNREALQLWGQSWWLLYISAVAFANELFGADHTSVW